MESNVVETKKMEKLKIYKTLIFENKKCENDKRPENLLGLWKHMRLTV